MFARTAKLLTLGRPQAVRAPVGQEFSKIREPDRLNAALRRRRPVLLCRWQLDSASGRPVCTWEVESPDLAPNLRINPGRPMPECCASPFWPTVWRQPATSDQRDEHERGIDGQLRSS
jgi:hypothetical protein